MAAGGDDLLRARGRIVDPVDVGAPELLIILALVLVLFGGAKLPSLARSLGAAKREFQKGLSDDEEKDHSEHAD
jgi:sec-independent protein translocase protein TatA